MSQYLFHLQLCPATCNNRRICFAFSNLSLVVVSAVFGYIDGFRLWTRKLFHRPALREIDKINSNTSNIEV